MNAVEVIFPANWTWGQIGDWFSDHFSKVWHDGYWATGIGGCPVWRLA